MKSEDTNNKDHEQGQQLKFAAMLTAVLNHDVPKMGVDTLLKKLIAKCQSTKMAQKLGFADTLTAYQKGTAIAQKADMKDPLAFAELKLLCTTFNAHLANVVANHPDMAAPFIRADVTWPVNEPYYKSENSDMPLERVKRLGFGANAKASGLPTFLSVFGLVALVLHLFLWLRDLLMGKEPKMMSETDAKAVALKQWNTSAHAAVVGSYGKWSQLPLVEINNIKKTRPWRNDVSGEVAFRIKAPFIKLAHLVNGLVNIVRNSPKQ